MTPWRITHVEETESTNLLARSGRPGDVFTADYQTAGRGRLDHRWLAARGQNLMMSAVIDVGGMEAEHAATLPLAVGLAVVEALRNLGGTSSCSSAFSVAQKRDPPEKGFDFRLKWPNDVLAGGRKLAGILCERHGDNAIVGIGVNVRQREFPVEIAGRATSLALLGSGTGVAEVRDAVLDALSQVVSVWRSGFASVYPRIASIDCLAGRDIAIRQMDAAAPSASGVCGGIQPDGSLLVGGESIWAGEAHVESLWRR
jgi:BirA family biotin operon repressor/biotin-[acetyl-CoA-carboxylase] ligase